MIDGVSDKVNKMVQSILSAQGQVAQQNRKAADSATKAEPPRDPQYKPMNVDDPIVREAVTKLNEESAKLKARLSLSIDSDLNRVLIRFKDPQSGEILRQIPPDALLDMLKRFDELKGAMFDTQG